MKICINCGNKENNNSTICEKCGGALNAVDGYRAICHNCGAEINPEMSFCGRCGSPVNGSATGMYSKTPSIYDGSAVPRFDSRRGYAPGRKSSNTILLAILIVLLLGVTVAATLLVVQTTNDNVANQEQKESDKTGKKEELEKLEEEQRQKELKEQEEQEERDRLELEEQKRKEETERKNRQRFQAVAGNYTWYDAKYYAATKVSNGKLACINSYDEFVQACNAASNAGLNAFWVGAYNPNATSYWGNVYWIDGSPMTYTKWMSGEPSGEDKNYNIPENYLMVLKRNGSWYFNDAPADPWKYNKSLKMGYVIEVG